MSAGSLMKAPSVMREGEGGRHEGRRRRHEEREARGRGRHGIVGHE